MRVAEEELPEMPGQDAFLDVLTNMVGIIILLVVVMGLRSSRAATASLGEDHAAVAAAAARAAAENELRDAHRDMLKTRYEVQQLMGRAVSARRETLLREQERQYLTTFVTAFDHELKDRRETLTTEEQRDFDLRRQLADAQNALEELSREQVTLLAQPAEAEVLENRPTPIVRQLSEKELFLQLASDHVAVIPFADLIEEFRAQAQENIWRLKDQDHFSGTVGPIGDYRMRYFIHKRSLEVRTPAGTVQQGTAVEVARFVLLPEESPPGDPIDEALQPNSEFLLQLKNFSPDTTTISIAVYPDSVRTLHRLKRVLHDGGYGVAEMLIPQGQPVTFSPNGQARYAQ